MFGFIRWMRRVLPVGEMVTLAVAPEMVIEVVYLIAQWRFFGFVNHEEFRRVRFGWLLICAAIYGAYRVLAFHPAADADYRRWLELTPWTADKPLPKGPLQLVPQDLVVICAIIFLYRLPTIDVLYFPTVFLTAYQLTLATYTHRLGNWILSYSILFVLGFVAFFIFRPEYAFAAADASFILGRIAVRRTLHSFPWSAAVQVKLRAPKQIVEEERRQRLGWPHDQLAPKAPERATPIHDGICQGLLVGWWWFVAISLMPIELRAIAPAMVKTVVLFAGFGRLFSYWKAHRSPINLSGRLWTMRWIIPGYDQIFVAPLVAFAISALFQGAAIALLIVPIFGRPVNPLRELLGISLSAIGVTLSSIVLAIGGPELEKWRLSGKHRIVFNPAASEMIGDPQYVEL